MIKLDVKPYCENCPEFEAEVECSDNQFYDSYGRVENIVHTTIRCKDARRCENFYRYYLSEQMKGENSND